MANLSEKKNCPRCNTEQNKTNGKCYKCGYDFNHSDNNINKGFKINANSWTSKRRRIKSTGLNPSGIGVKLLFLVLTIFFGILSAMAVSSVIYASSNILSMILMLVAALIAGAISCFSAACIFDSGKIRKVIVCFIIVVIISGGALLYVFSGGGQYNHDPYDRIASQIGSGIDNGSIYVPK